MLKEIFIRLLSEYSDNTALCNELWTEIEKNYNSRKRHYHTLIHLENLLLQLNEVKDEIQQWNTILFTLFYHDAVYNPLKSDNEEKSAALAEKRMHQLSVPDTIIEVCKEQILATKSHLISQNSDTNYFTDADLSVLGTGKEEYIRYFKNVRKEYSIFPDFLYNPGRKKTLKHFLEMDRIFKTDYFYGKLESQAQKNLTYEISQL